MIIEERLENMERELGRVKRRNRWLLGVIVLVAGGLIVPLVFETTAKDIRARSIYVEDEKGDTRAALFVNENGPILRLSGEDGYTRAVLGVFKDGPKLWLSDENGKHRVILHVNKDGLAGLGLYDGNGKARVKLTVTKYGPSLMLSDENDKIRATLDVIENGPTLLLSDEKGHDRFVAGKAGTVSPDGKTIEYPESSLILYGPDGKVIWSAIE
jgi:hypothetical protein